MAKGREEYNKIPSALLLKAKKAEKSNAVNNAKLRYECEGTASGRSDSEAENKKETLGDVIRK